MRQALEALEQMIFWYGCRDKNEVMMDPSNQNPEVKKSMHSVVALRTAIEQVEKRQWVGLTDEEIMEMLDYGQYGRVPQYARNFVDAIEAKLKEKNHG